jgi:hypothetical protein
MRYLKNRYILVVRKPQENSPLGRLWSGWEDNNITSLKQIKVLGYELDSSGSEQDPTTENCEHESGPSRCTKRRDFLIRRETTIFSRRASY